MPMWSRMWTLWVAQDPRVSVTLLAAVGLRWLDGEVASSHQVVLRSFNFSRKKKRAILDFHSKSLDLLMSPINLIFRRTQCRPNEIYLTWIWPTDDLCLNFLACLPFALAITCPEPPFSCSCQCHTLRGVMVHWNSCQFNLDFQVIWNWEQAGQCLIIGPLPHCLP